ncbi:MAG: hypothetical protein JWM18_3392 [Chloroflexi bacterium]|jgi:hypothetical protein|nr:hypothetical protein [Chloroflexota bacterium]
MNGNPHIETPPAAPDRDAGAGFHPSALHPSPDPTSGAGEALEITLECIGRPAPRTASAPTMRFGYHPHATRVRRGAVTEGSLETPAVVILDAVSGRQLGVCSGPGPDGRCPMAGPGETVLCSGRRVRAAALEAGRTSRFLVAAGSSTCPLAWLAVTR